MATPTLIASTAAASTVSAKLGDGGADAQRQRAERHHHHHNDCQRHTSRPSPPPPTARRGRAATMTTTTAASLTARRRSRRALLSSYGAGAAYAGAGAGGEGGGFCAGWHDKEGRTGGGACAGGVDCPYTTNIHVDDDDDDDDDKIVHRTLEGTLPPPRIANPTTTTTLTVSSSPLRQQQQKLPQRKHHHQAQTKTTTTSTKRSAGVLSSSLQQQHMPPLVADVAVLDNQGLGTASAASSASTSAGAVRRRRRRITRRLASPRSVLMGSSGGNYLISPWTTELDDDIDVDDDDIPAAVSDSDDHLGDDELSDSVRRTIVGGSDVPTASASALNSDGGVVVPSSSDGLRRRRRTIRAKRFGGGGVVPELSSSSSASVSDDVAAAAPSNVSMVGATPSSGSKDQAKGKAYAKKLMSKSERQKIDEAKSALSFATFRITYLIVHIAIMLSDGLQGTHLYVLYEGYGYSVASLYCLGFVSGALTSPFIGPFVDKIGRKKAALLYCALEVFINLLEQYPLLAGLLVSRIIGGITTNLLFSVFESWLVTEHRRRGYADEELETILRDSVIASNLAAIASGWLAHWLASVFGPVGPFEGAVACTSVALALVAVVWTENYGCATPGVKSVGQYMAGALHTIVSDSNISRIGIIQGFTEGALQTFVFLWSPALRHFAVRAPLGSVGLDTDGQPAYGLIFGAFMACGVLGGLAEPTVRSVATTLVRDRDRLVGFCRRDTVIFVEGGRGDEAGATSSGDVNVDGKGDGRDEEVKPAAVEFLTTFVYFVCGCLLLTPFLLPEDSPHSFSIALGSFLVYEFMIGLYMPCEGVIRSIYMPTASICSLMTMLRVIVNVCVALGVVSTNYINFTTAFAVIASLMFVSSVIQLSMVSPRDWANFVDRIKAARRRGSFHFRHSILGTGNGGGGGIARKKDESEGFVCASPAKKGTKPLAFQKEQKQQQIMLGGRKGSDEEEEEEDDDDATDGPLPPLECSPGSSISHAEETSSEEEDNSD